MDTFCARHPNAMNSLLTHAELFAHVCVRVLCLNLVSSNAIIIAIITSWVVRRCADLFSVCEAWTWWRAAIETNKIIYHFEHSTNTFIFHILLSLFLSHSLHSILFFLNHIFRLASVRQKHVAHAAPQHLHRSFQSLLFRKWKIRLCRRSSILRDVCHSCCHTPIPLLCTSQWAWAETRREKENERTCALQGKMKLISFVCEFSEDKRPKCLLAEVMFFAHIVFDAQIRQSKIERHCCRDSTSPFADCKAHNIQVHVRRSNCFTSFSAFLLTFNHHRRRRRAASYEPREHTKLCLVERKVLENWRWMNNARETFLLLLWRTTTVHECAWALLCDSFTYFNDSLSLQCLCVAVKALCDVCELKKLCQQKDK